MLEVLLNVVDLKVGLLVGVMFCVVKSYLYSRPPKGLPPGPPTIPFIGNLNLTKNNQRVHETIHQLGKKYGAMFSFQLGWYPGVVINDYNLMKEAFTKLGDQTSHRMGHLFFMKLMNQENYGVINSGGENWKASRRFCLSSLRDFGMGKASIEGKILEEADNLLFEIGKQRGEPFQFELLFKKASANIICSMLFGKRFEYKDPEYIAILQALKLHMESSNLFTALPILVPCLMPMLFLDRKIFGNLKNWNNLESFCKKQMKEHRQKFDPDHVEDFLDAFIEAERQHKDSGIYSERNYLTMVLDLFIAGADTTSATLDWATLFMLQNPHVQDKCRQEIWQVIGKDRKPTLKDREHMPYIEATLCEVQRLGNIAPLSVTHSTYGSVELNGYTLPHQTMIVPDIYSVHMNPDLWEEPKTFRPERFLKEGKVHRPPYFIPFSIGRRACMGENLAKSEMFLFFVTMLQNYEYTCEDVTKLPTLSDVTCGITLTPDSYEVMANPV